MAVLGQETTTTTHCDCRNAWNRRSWRRERLHIGLRGLPKSAGVTLTTMGSQWRIMLILRLTRELCRWLS